MTAKDLPFDAARLQHADAFILTSQRAAASLPTDQLERLVFTTGNQTAEAARHQGYKEVLSAEGDWHDLAALIIEHAKPHSRLCHLSGHRQRGELAKSLSLAGLHYDRLNVYAMEDVAQAPPAITDWLAEPAPGIVLFYSPATAAIWQRLSLALGPISHKNWACCLSQACAAALVTDDWAGIAVAELPDEQALWRSLETIG